jgi:uncharacterized membrane protein YkvA (DUF1232 family)
VPQRESSTRELVFAIPDILRLLWHVVRDSRVPKLIRGGLVGIAAYLALPFDIIPDWIPIAGQVDDVVVLTVGVRTLLRRVPEEVLREHWRGEHHTLETLLGRAVRDPSANGA